MWDETAQGPRRRPTAPSSSGTSSSRVRPRAFLKAKGTLPPPPGMGATQQLRGAIPGAFPGKHSPFSQHQFFSLSCVRWGRGIRRPSLFSHLLSPTPGAVLSKALGPLFIGQTGSPPFVGLVWSRLQRRILAYPATAHTVIRLDYVGAPVTSLAAEFGPW